VSVKPGQAVLLWLIASAPGACADRSATGQPLMVFAAASLTAPFGDLVREFGQRNPDTRVALHFAGTPRLVVQIREGAPVDVFAAADEINMQRAADARAPLATPRIFAHNRLAIVTPAGNPDGVGGLADLVRPGLRVLFCGPRVPAGRYARQALAKAGVEVGSMSDEPSVKAVLSKVLLGEADAGIVYATDARQAAPRVEAIAIPAPHNVVADYPIGVFGDGRSGAAAAEFVAFVLSDAGRGILRSHGFSTP